MFITLTGGLDNHCFQPDFCNARQQFLDRAAALGAIESHLLEGFKGPVGETLATDVLWLGPDDATSVLVLTSGTHGVEGYAGAAIQADLLQRLATGHAQLPDGCALLVIHALNPWGMSWLRRCDQQGIDLNRNFIDFAQPLPDNPGYRALRDVLLSGDAAQRALACEAYARKQGQRALEVAISGGQYVDPTGPFFGGTGPARARLLIESLMARFLLPERRLAVIDLHTGLGPYGYGEVICDHEPESDGTTTARQWYGDAVTLPLAGTSSSVPKLGLMDFGWHAIMGGDSCFVTLEFGTYSTERLFSTILDDHRLHAAGTPDWQHPTAQQVKLAMHDHFCPAADQWRDLVLFRARQVINLALRGLQHD